MVLEATNWTSCITTLGFAYFFGYVAYVIGSYLDVIFDKIKLFVLRKEVRGASGHDDSTIDYVDPNYTWKFLRFWHFCDTHNLIVMVARLKEKHDILRFEYPSRGALLLDDKVKEKDKKMHNHMNAYQYAFRRLMLEDKFLMFGEVIRYYVTAKFFGSMTVVLLIGSFLWMLSNESSEAIPWIFFMSALSFLVYLNRRRKANHVAYKNLIVAYSKNVDEKTNIEIES